MCAVDFCLQLKKTAETELVLNFILTTGSARSVCSLHHFYDRLVNDVHTVFLFPALLCLLSMTIQSIVSSIFFCRIS